MMKILYLPMIILAACQSSELKTEKTKPSPNITTKKNEVTASEDRVFTDSTDVRIDRFMRFILDSNFRYITFAPSDKSFPKYLKMFNQQGLNLAHTYSRKNYPKKKPPSEYQHFCLFILEYDSDSSSTTAFSQLIALTEFKNGKKDLPYHNVETMRIYAKYGGLIVKKANYILSLVEQCGGLGTLPYKSWEEYEQDFLNMLFKKTHSGYIYLDADCGMDHFETIVPFEDAK